MTSLRTTYEFTLPRGYVDTTGQLHRTGVMRLATARDELEPLRDPRVQGPDDPRLTIMVLTRVITQLGSMEMVTAADIEGLFAVDLAYLQDFYGVINFGNQAEFEELVAAQAATQLVGSQPARPSQAAAAAREDEAGEEPEAAAPTPAPEASREERPSMRRAVEELPRRTS